MGSTMGCEHIKLPGGIDMIVCTRGARRQRCECGRPSTKACDFPITPRTGKKRTCDKPLCDSCRHEWTPELGRPAEPPPGDSFDLCRAHADYIAQLPPEKRPPRAEQQRLKLGA